MICIDCGGEYIEARGTIIVEGHHYVDDVEYEYCNKCGEMLFPPETIDKLEEAIFEKYKVKKHKPKHHVIDPKEADKLWRGAEAWIRLNKGK